MKYTAIIILLILFCQKSLLIAQGLVQIDTMSLRKITICHSSASEKGHLMIPTDETIDMYEWDIQDGLNIIYRTNGEKYMEGKYSNKKMVEFWKYYDTVGNLDFEVNYQNKTKVFYYSSGVKKAEGKYKITRPVDREFRVKNWKFYYPNGNLKCAGKLNIFGKVGVWSFYDENGDKIGTEFYSRQLLRFYKSVNVDSNYNNVCDCKKMK